MKILLTLAFLIFIPLLSALSDEPQTFRIGAILPLSGPAAEYGFAIQNSISLAKQDNPEAFEHIQFIFEDAQYDTKLAVAAFKKLVEVDRVDLIYTWGVGFCKAIAPLAESAKIPMVGQCIDPTVGTGRNYVIRFMNYTDEYLAATAGYLHGKALNNIGIVAAESAYIEEMLAALKRNLLPGQRVTVVDTRNSQDMDLRSAISRLKGSQFDVIGVFLEAGQVSQFYKQARNQGLTTPTFGTNLFENLSEVAAAGGAMEGAVFTNNEVKKPFHERYMRIYGNESDLAFGAPAYEFAAITADLFGNLPEKPRGEAVIGAYSSVVSRQGYAAGPYSFQGSKETGKYFKFPLVVKVVRGGGFIDLSPQKGQN